MRLRSRAGMIEGCVELAVRIGGCAPRCVFSALIGRSERSLGKPGFREQFGDETGTNAILSPDVVSLLGRPRKSPMFLTLLFIYFPALVFGLLFIKNYRKEPRQFRNSLYFLLLCLFALWGLSVQFNLPWLVLLGFASVPFGTVALVVFLLANAFVVVRRKGFPSRICCRRSLRSASSPYAWACRGSCWCPLPESSSRSRCWW